VKTTTPSKKVEAIAQIRSLNLFGWEPKKNGFVFQKGGVARKMIQGLWSGGFEGGLIEEGCCCFISLVVCFRP
jgi:hypothetical protein